jgi:prepilin-type N-terminal cleavage/methylation domain-containing protein
VRHANRTNRSRPRAGVTLIEILVVLAIITLLVSLSMAAYQRVRLTQMVRTTENVVEKLQMGVDNQVKIIADGVRLERQRRSPDFEAMYSAAGGDADRGEALLMYCRLRQNFPLVSEMTGTGFTFTLNGFSVFFPWPKALLPLQGMGGTAEQQSAAVLYLALSQRTQNGNTFDSDAATSGAQADLPVGAGTFRVYKDSWGNPVPFQRFWQSAELDLPPYAKAGATARDPYDPLGKLAAWPAAARNSAENQLGYASNALINNRNKTILVYSWGPNKVADLSNAGSGDDVVGYRLRSIARKGDQ